MKNSDFGKLNQFDFYKGLIVSSVSAGLNIVYQTLENGTFGVNWNTVAVVSTCSAVGYIIKNLFTDSDGQIKKPM